MTCQCHVLSRYEKTRKVCSHFLMFYHGICTFPCDFSMLVIFVDCKSQLTMNAMCCGEWCLATPLAIPDAMAVPPPFEMQLFSEMELIVSPDMVSL
jgi:hypothetical protein